MMLFNFAHIFLKCEGQTKHVNLNTSATVFIFSLQTCSHSCPCRSRGISSRRMYGIQNRRCFFFLHFIPHSQPQNYLSNLILLSAHPPPSYCLWSSSFFCLHYGNTFSLVSLLPNFLLNKTAG